MKTSEEIKDIAAALNKAQAEMTGAKKANDNPFFKSKYSDLSHVMEAISKPFADNGLSFVQSPELDNGMIVVVTRIMHNSGQWLENTIALPPVKNDAQGFGSAISYAKRYSLQAMAGCPSVDDDGNDAVTHAAPKPQPKTRNIDKAVEIKPPSDWMLAMRNAKDIDTLGELFNNAQHQFKKQPQILAEIVAVKDECKAVLMGGAA